MSNPLIEKIRKAREQKIPVGGYTFTVRRPTDIEMLGLSGTGTMGRLLPFVVDWGDIKELDIIPGGDPHLLPFNADVCAEWLSDRADLLGPLVKAILDSYHQHEKDLADAVKN